MGLSSALFTGLTGLDVNQTNLTVVGNNIANANTTAFKSSRALFTPQFYVTDRSGSPATSDFGGQNPSQEGLGATVAAIQKDFSAGSIQATGKDTDLALDGDGFFITQGKDQHYTRDGAFTLNPNNQLVATDGSFVQGYGIDANNNIVAGTLQNVTIPLGQLTSAKATSKADFEGNLNADGTVATGASILNTEPLTIVNGGGVAAAPSATTALTDVASTTASTTSLFNVGDVLTLSGKKGGRDQAPISFTVGAGSTLGDLSSFFQQGLGVDPTIANSDPTGPQPGVTVDATGSTSVLTITGNLGSENALSLTGTALTDTSGTTPLAFSDGVDSLGNLSKPSGESVNTSFVAYDSLGTPITIDLTATLESRSSTGTTWRFAASSADDTDAAAFDPAAASHQGEILGNGTITFDNSGQLISSTNSTINIDRKNTGATSPLSVALDFSGMSSLTSQNSNLVNTQQDGSSTGTLDGFSIGSNGVITGTFSNGLTRSLGQVAVATFQNEQGLTDNGGGNYSVGANSGVAIVSAPGDLGSGLVRAGALEASNVDLSKEFVNMIISSTGFSASSRVITTSNQMLTELLNTSR